MIWLTSQDNLINFTKVSNFYQALEIRLRKDAQKFKYAKWNLGPSDAFESPSDARDLERNLRSGFPDLAGHEIGTSHLSLHEGAHLLGPSASELIHVAEEDSPLQDLEDGSRSTYLLSTLPSPLVRLPCSPSPCSGSSWGPSKFVGEFPLASRLGG